MRHPPDSTSVPARTHLACMINLGILSHSHGHLGQPDGLVVCHLPHGPTAHFSLSDVALRHDLPSKPENMSEVRK